MAHWVPTVDRMNMNKMSEWMNEYEKQRTKSDNYLNLLKYTNACASGCFRNVIYPVYREHRAKSEQFVGNK
jgi:hypothetical protein